VNDRTPASPAALLAGSQLMQQGTADVFRHRERSRLKKVLRAITVVFLLDAFLYNWYTTGHRIGLPSFGPEFIYFLPVIGIFVAYWFAARLPEAGMQMLLGLISTLFAARSLWLQRGGRVPAPADPPRWFGFLMGIGSGVTSQIAHAGQPLFQIYVLPKRLPRDVLVGTTAIFFAAVNWIKVPAYLALGQFSRAHLLASLIMMPVALASTFAGVWVVRRVDTERFYAVIYWLMIGVGLKLVWDGFA